MRRPRLSCCALIAGLTLGVQLGQSGAAAADSSSYSKSTGGTKVLYLFLHDLGYRMQRIFEMNDLWGGRDHPASDVALVIGPVSRRPAEKALAWARRGGLLIIAPPLVSKKSQCKDVAFGSSLTISRHFRYGAENSAKADLDQKLLVRPAACVLKVPPTGKALASTQDGAIVFEHSVGKGKLLVLAHEDMLRNFLLDRDDLAVILRRWLDKNAPLRARIAYFERHAGGQLWRMLEKANMLPLLGHGLLLLLLIYWKATPRFGDADSFSGRRRRAFALHARALGALYQRSGASAHALGQIYERFRRRLRFRVRVQVANAAHPSAAHPGGVIHTRAAAADREALAERLATRTGRDQASVDSLLTQVEQAAGQRVAKDARGMQRDFRLAAALTHLVAEAGVGESAAKTKTRTHEGGDDRRH